MDQMARQFWLFVVPLLVGFSAVGLLILAFFFPQDIYEVGSVGYIATAGVAVVSLGILVWQSVAYEDHLVGGVDRPPR